MQKYGFVYIWRDRKHKRYYIGCHWGTEDDGYICSSKWMLLAYKRRQEDFKRRILSKIYTNKKDMFKEENHWLSMIKNEELKTKYYNVTTKWEHWASSTDRERSTRENISIKTKEAMQRPDVKEKYKAGLEKRDTKSSDPEVREKRRQSMKKTMAEKFPEENRRKKLTSEQRKEYYSNKAKDIWSKPGYKEKVGPKISEGLKGVKNRLGHTNSEEHRKRISESLKGKVHQRFKVSINGTIYQSSTEASIILGISGSTINRRIKSDKYPEYNRIGIQ